MIKQISPGDTSQLTASDGLFAVFDVRERGEYNDGQIPYATSLPRSQIEFRIDALVPEPKNTDRRLRRGREAGGTGCQYIG